jgi:hypothetical protein
MPKPEIISGSVEFAIHDKPHTQLAIARWQEFKNWLDSHLARAAREHGIAWTPKQPPGKQKNRVHRRKTRQ